MGERQLESAAEREAVRSAARNFAFDWYLSALLTPRHMRSDLVTLAAFIGETSRIPLTVTDPGIGAIRLQWWRDAINNGLGGTQTGNPVADALTEIMRRLSLPATLIERALNGYECEFEADGLGDEASFETYLHETWSTAFRLAARVLANSETVEIEQACKLSAAAYGRTRLALDLPRHLSHGRLPLPAARFAQNDPRTLPEIEARSAARTLITTLAKEARQALAEARAAIGDTPEAVRPAFLPLALVEPYLRALEVPGHDPLRDLADISPLTRVARLWLARVRGTA